MFAVIFICAGFIVKNANDKVYSFLYPQQKQVFIENCPKTVKIKNGDYFALGIYNNERLVWKCVLNNKAQCEKIIDFRQYDSENSDWKTSELRKWLNSDNGFSEKAMIKNNTIIDGEIYVLSKGELEKIDNIAKQPTLSAVKNSDSKYLFLRKNCWYWTSSSISTNSQSVAAVTQNGGFYKTLPTDSLTGVCPAFTMKNSTVHILGGDGSKEKPYVIG